MRSSDAVVFSVFTCPVERGMRPESPSCSSFISTFRSFCRAGCHFFAARPGRGSTRWSICKRGRVGLLAHLMREAILTAPRRDDERLQFVLRSACFLPCAVLAVVGAKKRTRERKLCGELERKGRRKLHASYENPRTSF